MYRTICKNSWKNLLRSWSFWLVLAVFAGLLAREGLKDYVTFAPGYEPTALSYERYVQGIAHRMANELLLALPFLAVTVTAPLLGRDYGDGFYEIEKAANVSPLRYLLGRLTVATAVTVAAQWVCSTAAVLVYAFRWGGVRGLSGGRLLTDCALRLLRVDVCAALPLALLCVAGTYLLGTLFRSGAAASVGMLALALGNDVFTLLYQYRAFGTYFDRLCPAPRILLRYVVYIDTADAELQRMGATFGGAVFSAAWLVGLAVLCAVAGYWKLRRRSI